MWTWNEIGFWRDERFRVVWTHPYRALKILPRDCFFLSCFSLIWCTPIFGREYGNRKYGRGNAALRTKYFVLYIRAYNNGLTCILLFFFPFSSLRGIPICPISIPGIILCRPQVIESWLSMCIFFCSPLPNQSSHGGKWRGHARPAHHSLWRAQAKGQMGIPL